MDQTEFKCIAALYGSGQPPTDAEVNESLKARAVRLGESEYNHQRRLHTWLAKNRIIHFHPPNELVREETVRGQTAIGLSCGVPDIVIPIARKPHHGLYLELKSEKGVLSGAQEWWLQRLSEEGYKAVTSWSLEESQEIVIKYLNQPRWKL